MSDASSVSEFVAQHPKMAGALFTMMLLLTQAGGVMAGNSNPIVGP
ncbi:DUF7503 family protein [Halosegnis marinus]|uniref:Uncharacterized protein n=1 Tax=Halosegnis marinus TaxID=3034023 RepID=A0ABD5ZL42_9EURY|nr:hypothetical protein [Halosegnis sp. DT85]